MLSYFLKCKKKTRASEEKNPQKIMILSKRVLCHSKISKFIKEQAFNRLSSSLGRIATFLSVILLVGPPLF